MLMSLGTHTDAVSARLKKWRSEDFASRLWSKDYRLWSAEPVPELTDRLGWLDLPARMACEIEELERFAGEVRDEGMKHLVLMGMGGSSLAPEVFQSVLGNAPGYPELTVLDSTHPDAVRSVEERIDLAKTLFIVSSKSGTTLETLSLFRYFWDSVGKAGEPQGKHFIAISDPGTPLQALASERGFRKSFEAVSDIGGRYSALSAFGLVPAALIGADVRGLLEKAGSMADACRGEGAGLDLGAAIGELTLAGRDKVTFLTSGSLEAFPAWIEQLIAESTGKDDRGIVPVAGEAVAAPGAYGKDRMFVWMALDADKEDGLEASAAGLEKAGHPVIRVRLARAIELGREMFRWEVPVACAGAVLGIHPFNQPDVQLAKELAKRAMEGEPGQSDGDDEPAVPAGDAAALKKAVAGLLSGAGEGDYISLQAYLAPCPGTRSALDGIRLAFRDRLKLATTSGYGPRFLHSTGQLHKGGPNTGIFLQLTDQPGEDLAVPETGYGFGALIAAQALGDYRALKQRGRRVLRVDLGRDTSAGLELLADAIR